MDEIDREIEGMLVLKEPKNFQEYLGVQIAREPEPTVNEQIRNVQWDFSTEKKRQWKKAKWRFIIMEAFLWGMVVLGTITGTIVIGDLLIEIGVFAGLVVFVIVVAAALVNDTEEEEKFKNEK